MPWICSIVFLLIAAGLFALFGLNVKDLVIKRRRKEKRTLMAAVKEAQGLSSKSIWANGGEIDQLLHETGRAGQRKRVIQVSIFLLAIGTILPVLLGNMFLAPVVGIGLALVPLWYLRAREAAYKKHLNEELETAVSTITTSYLRTEDLVRSVRENLVHISRPLRDDFEDFIYETDMINANVAAAIHELKRRIPNRIFSEWCDALLQCQSDRNMLHTLPAILEKFSDVRIVQSRLETLMSQPKKEAITMMFLVVANIPLLYVLNRDWFHTLMFSTPGQIVLAACAGIILFAFVRIQKLSKPIEYAR